MNLRKKLIYPLILSVSLSGCSFLDKELNILGKYETVSEKATSILEEPQEKINIEILEGKKDKEIDIYENKFQVHSLGDSNIINYHAQNMNPLKLKKTLEEQLGDYVDKISVIEDTNQILIKYKRPKIEIENNAVKEKKDIKNNENQNNNFMPALSNILKGYNPQEEIESQKQILKQKEEKEEKRQQKEKELVNLVNNEIQNVVKSIDRLAPQFQIEFEIKKIMADYTKDVSAILNATPTELAEDYYPMIKLDLKGAELRVPDRALTGTEYSFIINKYKKYILDMKLNQLESRGFAEDIASPTLVLDNGKKAKISLSEEFPYQEDTIVGGAIVKKIEYKEIANFLEVSPEARAKGNIFLNFKAGVGTFNPSSVMQLPMPIKRDTENTGVTLRNGETLTVAGFLYSQKYGVERQDPYLKYIPFFGKLFSGKDIEKKKNMIIFMATPYYTNTED